MVPNGGSICTSQNHLLHIPLRSRQEMGGSALLLLKATPPMNRLFTSKITISNPLIRNPIRAFCTRSALQPPDLPQLAETARISLTPQEVEEFAPKIRQVIDWFGQLQAVDLQCIEPSIRAGTEGDNLRGDSPGTFENREAIIAAIPSYEEPYLKVPKVLNKD